jgi:hypothetical protein
MLTRPNDGGGTTLVLAEGDDLDAVPDSHRDIVTDVLRHTFRDPSAYFSELAGRTPIPNLQRYLSRFVSDGRWSLLLADTYMMDRKTIAAYQWFHPDQYPCMFGPSTGDCNDRRFSTFYDGFSLVHWDSIGYSGGIVPYRGQITVANYGAPSINPIFPPDSTVVFGISSCGDMMVCSTLGEAGYLSHENGASYVVGTFHEMLVWIFGELIENRTPEFDYNRC